MATILEKVIIEPTTDAVISELITLPQDATSMSAVANDFTDAENATVEVYDKALDDWFPYNVAGLEQKLEIGTNVLDFYWTHARYRINKTATTNPVGVTLYQYRAN